MISTVNAQFQTAINTAIIERDIHQIHVVFSEVDERLNERQGCGRQLELIGTLSETLDAVQTEAATSS